MGGGSRTATSLAMPAGCGGAPAATECCAGYTLVLKDLTKGWSHTVNKTLAGAANSSAEVIVEAPCCTAGGGILPLAHFSPVTFTNASVNGSAIGNASPTQIIMVDGSGRDKDSISSLSGGNSFTATWLRAN